MQHFVLRHGMWFAPAAVIVNLTKPQEEPISNQLSDRFPDEENSISYLMYRIFRVSIHSSHSHHSVESALYVIQPIPQTIHITSIFPESNRYLTDLPRDSSRLNSTQ